MVRAPFRNGLLAALAASLVCGLTACGGVGAPSQAPDAIYATTPSGNILTLPYTGDGPLYVRLGSPTSVAGPAGSQGLMIATLSATQYVLYASDPTANAIRVYYIGQSSDQPTPAGIGPFPLGNGNGSPEVMVTRSFGLGGPLYVATSKGMIAGFNLGIGGALTPVSASPVATGAAISQLFQDFSYAAQPAAQSACLYASEDNDPSGGIAAFRLQGNGALAPVAGSPFATAPAGGPTAFYSALVTAAATPKQYLYVGLSNTGAIAAFAQASDCSLSPLAGSPFPAAKGIASLFAAGTTLFAGNSADGTISSFTIDQSTGALTPAATVRYAGVGGSGSALDAYGLIFLPNPSTDALLGLQFSGNAQGAATIAPLPASPFYAGSGTLALAFLWRPPTDPP